MWLALIQIRRFIALNMLTITKKYYFNLFFFLKDKYANFFKILQSSTFDNYF
jgi:hypothetical protein